MNFIQIARYILGLSWIYQGFFPKIYHVASLELAMTSRLGLSHEHTLLLIRATGIMEILFGLCLILFYKKAFWQKLNILALLGLLFVAVFMIPGILFDAFNPVTTNLPLIALGFYLLKKIPLQKQG